MPPRVVLHSKQLTGLGLSRSNLRQVSIIIAFHLEVKHLALSLSGIEDEKVFQKTLNTMHNV